jgi:hypothetical protein
MHKYLKNSLKTGKLREFLNKYEINIINMVDCIGLV